MSGDPLRIAMWSGPRCLSTALMRSFENRPDTEVSDEPLYGYYLRETGAAHPGAAEIIEAMETDWRAVVATLTGPAPAGAAIWYQKHMAHHLLPEIDREWMSSLQHVILLRDPRRVVASYARRRAEVRPEDLGFEQLAEISDYVARQGRPVIAVDADVLVRSPRRVLLALCDALEIEFREEMLSWRAGPRPSDGVWAPHWYAGVWASTGFSPTSPAMERLSPGLERVVDSLRAAHGRVCQRARMLGEEVR